MTVVPPSDHLFVIFIFDDAVFSHGRFGSVSVNVVDAIINVIVIIVFFFLIFLYFASLKTQAKVFMAAIKRRFKRDLSLVKQPLRCFGMVKTI